MKTHKWFYIIFLRQPLCKSFLWLKHEKTADYPWAEIFKKYIKRMGVESIELYTTWL